MYPILVLHYFANVPKLASLAMVALWRRDSMKQTSPNYNCRLAMFSNISIVNTKH
jgi:hypothetical protein